MAPTQSSRVGLDRSGRRRIVQILFFMAVHWVVLFTAAGSPAWPAGWLYVGLSLLALAIGAIWIIRVNPEIINERGRRARDTEPFDKVFAVVYFPLPFVVEIVAGLDHRFGWSAVATALQAVAFAAYFLSALMPYWAMSVNRFLTTTVRIQRDRGHRVVTTGPYRVVRHPMYAGAIVQAVCAPVALGSWWALFPAGLIVALFIWRTALEDRTLRAELAGYGGYARQVRYRLLPGVW